MDAFKKGTGDNKAKTVEKTNERIDAIFNKLYYKPDPDMIPGQNPKETYTAAALKVALESTDKEEKESALDILRKAGVSEIGKAYSELLRCEDAHRTSAGAFTMVLAEVFGVGAVPSQGEQQKAAPSSGEPVLPIAKPQPPPTKQEGPVGTEKLIERVKAFGFDQKVVSYLIKVCETSPSRVSIIENSLDQCTSEIITGSVSKGALIAVLNIRPSALRNGGKYLQEALKAAKGESTQILIDPEMRKNSGKVLSRLKEFGLCDSAMEYLKDILSRQPDRIGTIAKSLVRFESAVECGEVQKDALLRILDKRPTVLRNGGGLVQGVIDQAKKGILAKKREIYKVNSEAEPAPAEPKAEVKAESKKADEERKAKLLGEMRDFGLSKSTVDYVEKALSILGDKVGTAIHILEVFKNAASSGEVDKENLIRAIDQAPSLFMKGKKHSENIVDRIRQGEPPRHKAKPRSFSPEASVSPANPKGKDENELLQSMREFGLSEETCKYVKKAHSILGGRLGTAGRVLEFFKNAVSAGEVDKEKLIKASDRYPSIYVQNRARSIRFLARVNAGAFSEEDNEQREKPEPLASPSEEGITPEYLKRKEENGLLLQRMKEFGLDRVAIGKVIAILNKRSQSTGTATNTFAVFERAVKEGRVSREAIVQAINNFTSCFSMGPKTAEWIVQREANGLAPNKEKKTGEEKPALKKSEVYKKHDKENDEILRRLKAFGVSNKVCGSLFKALCARSDLTGSIRNSVEYCEQAVEDGVVTQEALALALSNSSILRSGKKNIVELVEKIASGNGKTQARKKASKVKVKEKKHAPTIARKSAIMASSTTAEGIANAAGMLRLSSIPDPATATHTELLDFVIAMVRALPKPCRPGNYEQKDIEEYILRYAKPKSEGGEGDSPQRYLEHLVVLVNRHGPGRAANILSSSLSILREKSKLRKSITKNPYGYPKRESSLVPLKEKMESMNFESAFIEQVISHTRISGGSTPMMVMRLERMEAELGGLENAKAVLIKRPKLLIYPKSEFERVFALEKKNVDAQSQHQLDPKGPDGQNDAG